MNSSLNSSGLPNLIATSNYHLVKIASSENTSPDILVELLDDSKELVRAAAAYNEKLPHRGIIKAAKDTFKVSEALVYNPNTPSDVLSDVWDKLNTGTNIEGNPTALSGFLSHPNTPWHVRKSLTDNIGLLKNSDVSNIIIDDLVVGSLLEASHSIQQKFFLREDLPVEFLSALSSTEKFAGLGLVTNYSNTPLEVLELIVNNIESKLPDKIRPHYEISTLAEIAEHQNADTDLLVRIHNIALQSENDSLSKLHRVLVENPKTSSHVIEYYAGKYKYFNDFIIKSPSATRQALLNIVNQRIPRSPEGIDILKLVKHMESICETNLLTTEDLFKIATKPGAKYEHQAKVVRRFLLSSDANRKSLQDYLMETSNIDLKDIPLSWLPNIIGWGDSA